MSQSDFASLHLQQGLIDNLGTLGYQDMTPIQAQSLPPVLAGKDVIAQAKTGSGKTVAFGLGLLNKLNVKRFRIQALVLCPTRELAGQVAKELRNLARAIHNIKILTLCGGTPFGPQIGSLAHGAHIVVGTPGRIEEHLRKGSLILDNLDTLVLDEADRMLDMGFQPSVEAIIEQAPAQRQTLLFSATYPNEIDAIAKRVMLKPVRVQLVSTHDSDSIEQIFYPVTGATSRICALQLLLKSYQPESSLVFCNTKAETQEVADNLVELGFSAVALHGDLDQSSRDQALVCFTNKSISILVATDVAARGLDINALDMVINYQLSRDPKVHIHRIGRTGRAGSKGVACTLYTEKERGKIEAIEDIQRHPVQQLPLPTLSPHERSPFQPLMATLQISGGRKQKVRPGDILGALTGDNGIAGKQVGKIHIVDNSAYVAISRELAKKALAILSGGKMKGRSYRVRMIKS